MTFHAGDMAVHGRDLADVAAGATAVGALLGWLPSIAALFTIVWTGIRIYDWYQGRQIDE